MGGRKRVLGVIGDRKEKKEKKGKNMERSRRL